MATQTPQEQFPNPPAANWKIWVELLSQSLASRDAYLAALTDELVPTLALSDTGAPGRILEDTNAKKWRALAIDLGASPAEDACVIAEDSAGALACLELFPVGPAYGVAQILPIGTEL